MTKLAIITGGSRGLGKSMALNLARKGRDIIITYHSKKAEAADVVKEIESVGRKAAALQLDVSQSESFVDFAGSVRKLLKEKFGRSDFDYLVNNAGTGVFGMFVDTNKFITISTPQNYRIKIVWLSAVVIPPASIVSIWSSVATA